MAHDAAHLSLAVVGHVASGKSTAVRRLLGLAKDSKFEDMSSPPSPITDIRVDQRNTDRAHGLTVDISLHKLPLRSKAITLVNTPGHKDFSKNAIKGIALAGAALLLTSKYELKAFLGATLERALWCHVMGVRHMIVCVNKLDIEPEETREDSFRIVKDSLSDRLAGIGFKDHQVKFVPVSLPTGDNVVEPSDRLKWHVGGTLLDALEALPAESVVHKDRPLRMVVASVQRINNVGTVAIARVCSGTVRVDTTVAIAPLGISSTVCSIQEHGRAVSEAGPGSVVGVHLPYIDASDLCRGMVMGVWRSAPRKVERIVAMLVSTDELHVGGVAAGYTPTLHCHTAQVPCRLARIRSKVDKRTGVSTPQFDDTATLQRGEGAIVELEPLRPLACEVFAEFPPLGRLLLRDMHTTVFVGVIKEVIFDSE